MVENDNDLLFEALPKATITRIEVDDGRPVDIPLELAVSVAAGQNVRIAAGALQISFGG